MKFSCTKENLKAGLTKVAHIAGKNVNLPILQNVLIRAKDGVITLATTDLEIGITTSLRGKVELEGEFTVSAKLLADYIALLPSERIDIELVETTLHIRCGTYQTKMRGVSAEDYPVIPTIEGGTSFSVPLETLQHAISEVVFATAHDETRAELGGVYIALQTAAITLAATDSYRLAEHTIAGEYGVTEGKSVIIPTKTLQEVARFTPESGKTTITITLSDNQALFSNTDVQLVSRIIEGRYPDYRQIIPAPDKQRTRARINRQELIRAIKAAALFSQASVNDVNLDFPQAKKIVVVSAVNAQSGESTSEIAAQVEGEDNGVVLNYRYLLDGLTHISAETVEITMDSATAPCVVRGEGEERYLYVIMPINR